jgi:hypothetical protein
MRTTLAVVPSHALKLVAVLPRLLLVEPDAASRAMVMAAIGSMAEVESVADFTIARSRLDTLQSSLLVTNLRLGGYNGLQLVYMAQLGGAGVRAVVYDVEYDAGLARETRRACAFYELLHRLPVTLPAYLGAVLPPLDRRIAGLVERRAARRGGRRRWDTHLLSSAAG